MVAGAGRACAGLAESITPSASLNGCSANPRRKAARVNTRAALLTLASPLAAPLPLTALPSTTLAAATTTASLLAATTTTLLSAALLSAA